MRQLGLKVVATVCLLAGLAGSSLAGHDMPAAGQAFSVDWYLMGSGGTVQVAGGDYELRGSIGQAVAGAAASTTHSLDAGFWHGVSANCADCIFINGFDPEN